MFPRRAATLIELIAAVSVIGTLTTLLLPAIQSARESARATICRNNLRQTGVALLNFSSSHKYFPKGAEGRYDRKLSPTNMIGLSWWAEILPRLDENAIADGLDRTGANPGWVYLNHANGQLIDGFGPSFFFCPSSTVDHFVKSGEFQAACPSYSGISGATNYEGFDESRVSRCCRSEGQISGGGVLIPNANVRLNQITDGTAKTLLVGEQSDFAFTEAGQPIKIGSGFLCGWLAGTYALGIPPNYGSWLAPSYNLTTIRYPLNENRYELPGIDLDLGANNPLISPHPGVVHFLYCDGSVVPVGDSIDLTILKSLATRDDGSGMSN